MNTNFIHINKVYNVDMYEILRQPKQLLKYLACLVCAMLIASFVIHLYQSPIPTFEVEKLGIKMRLAGGIMIFVAALLIPKKFLKILINLIGWHLVLLIFGLITFAFVTGVRYLAHIACWLGASLWDFIIHPQHYFLIITSFGVATKI